MLFLWDADEIYIGPLFQMEIGNTDGIPNLVVYKNPRHKNCCQTQCISRPNPIKQPLFLVEIVNQEKKPLRLQVGNQMQNQHLLKGDYGEVPVLTTQQMMTCSTICPPAA